MEINPTDFQNLNSAYTPNPNAKVLDLIPNTDLRLHQKTASYDIEANKKELAQLVLDLTETMRYHNGIGLSAIQVGIPVSVFIVENGEEVPLVFINAKIVGTSEQQIELDEGCLSYPGVTVKVTRPAMIRVRFTNQHNDTNTQQFGGLSARVIQHEYDHTQGKTMKKHVSQVKWEQAKKRKRKI